MCVVVTATLEGGYLLVADCSPLPQMYTCMCVNMHVSMYVSVHVNRCVHKQALLYYRMDWVAVRECVGQ